MHLNGSISVSKTTILSLKDEHENDCQRRAQAVSSALEDDAPEALSLLQTRMVAYGQLVSMFSMFRPRLACFCKLTC